MTSPPSASGATEPVDRARLARMRDEVGEVTTRRFVAAYLDRSLREGKAPGSRQMALLRREADAVVSVLPGVLDAVGGDDR